MLQLRISLDGLLHRTAVRLHSPLFCQSFHEPLSLFRIHQHGGHFSVRKITGGFRPNSFIIADCQIPAPVLSRIETGVSVFPVNQSLVISNLVNILGQHRSAVNFLSFSVKKIGNC